MASSDIVLNIVTRGANLAKTQLNNLGSSGDKTGKNLQQLSNMAKFAGVAIGVALVKGISSAVQELAQFEDKLNQSLAIMKTSTEEQRAMASAAREVASSTRISANDSAEAFFFLASAGLDATQSIAALPQVAAFAQAGMFDMATATDLATDAQSALGLTVSDSEQNLKNLTRVTDVLVKGNTLANASVQQFSEALTTKAGAALKVVNKDIEEGVAVLAVFADRGVKGAEAGDKLNQVLRDIPRATAKNKEEFAALGLEMFDAQGNMKNVADIVEQLDAVLGPMSDELKASTLDQLGLNRGVADAVKILSGSTEQIRQYEEALRDSGGITQEVADKQMQSLIGQTEVLSNKFSVLKQLIGEDFEGAAKGTVSILDKLITKIIDLKEAQKAEEDEVQRSVYAYRTKMVMISGTLVPMREMYRLSIDLEKAHDDERDAVEAYNAGLEDLRPSIEAITEAQDEAKEAASKLREEQIEKGLSGLKKIQTAYRNLNDIYEHHNDLKKEELEKAEKLNSINNKMETTEEDLAKAKARALELATDGTEKSNEERLAIARQERTIQDLIDVEEKDEIQKLQLAVAKERLIELEEEAIARSRESIQAEEDVAEIEKELLKLEKDRTEAQAELTEATNDYNKATAKTPENLLDIAIAKRELDLAIADVKAIDSFKEGINQMIEFAGGKFDELAKHFQNLMNMQGFRADQVAGDSMSEVFGDDPLGDGGGLKDTSVKFDEKGLEDISKPSTRIASLGDFQAGNVNNNSIVVNVGGALSSSDEITEAVASAVVEAQRRGIKVLI
jgi:TP901 family phage tail tape measure protein